MSDYSDRGWGPDNRSWEAQQTDRVERGAYALEAANNAIKDLRATIAAQEAQLRHLGELAAEREGEQNTKIAAQAEEIGRLREALNNIAGGFIDSAFATKTPPDWHNAYDQVQSIALTALAQEGKK